MADNSDPQRLFARQALRTALVGAWFDALSLGPGDTVVDIGCGAGYVSLRAAERVGPSGRIHALDTDAEALGFLEELAALHGLAQIQTRLEDTAAMAPLEHPPRGSLLTMVLHHAAERPATLARIAEATHGAPILLAEFDTNGPCRTGPPRGMRLSRAAVVDDARAAGLRAHGFTQQSSEHWYMLLGPA